jgi:hypothetical protein
VLNVAGMWAARVGNLSDASYGAALRVALAKVLEAGFERVWYLTTAAAHPINFRHSRPIPSKFWGLNAVRATLVSRVARRAIASSEFGARIGIIDIEPLTMLMEEHSERCFDMRHSDAHVNAQIMSLVKG